MSYVTLTNQYKETLMGKFVKYVKQGLLTGKDTIGNDVDFEIKGLDIDTMSYIIDELMEVKYSVLQLEF